MQQQKSQSYEQQQIILGLDLGTSGIRATIVQRCAPLSQTESFFPDVKDDRILLEHSVAFNAQNLGASQNILSPNCATTNHQASVQSPQQWQAALEQLLQALAIQFDLNRIDAIIADATSSTLMLADIQGNLLSNALMYNDAQAIQAAQTIKQIQKNNMDAQKTAATGASSSLAKVLFLAELLACTDPEKPLQIVHQIDWLNNLFCDFLPHGICFSDENNLLKLGYDPVSGEFPEWVQNLMQQKAPNVQLPRVGRPGEVLAKVSAVMRERWGFAEQCRVLFGTTDSIAGFFASGAQQLGDAVTSLGSTLAIKQLVAAPVFAPGFGLYSHKVKSLWLLGGASNGGGKVLLNYYELKQIVWLDHFLQCLWRLDKNGQVLECLTDFPVLQHCRKLGDFYALPSQGERFPINDAELVAQLANSPQMPFNKIDTDIFTVNRFAEIDNAQMLQTILQQLFGDDLAIVLAHAQFFASIVQGLTQIEKQAFTLIESNQPVSTSSNLYSVGGGTQNGYWQLLRAEHLENCLQSAFSLDAAYGVTRLANFE